MFFFLLGRMFFSLLTLFVFGLEALKNSRLLEALAGKDVFVSISSKGVDVQVPCIMMCFSIFLWMAPVLQNEVSVVFILNPQNVPIHSIPQHFHTQDGRLHHVNRSFHEIICLRYCFCASRDFGLLSTFVRSF